MTAIGVCVLIQARLIMLVAEGLYQAITIRFKLDFSHCKIYSGIALVSIAVISSWMRLGKIIGVREGTTIVVLLIGALIQRLMPKLNFIRV